MNLLPRNSLFNISDLFDNLYPGADRDTSPGDFFSPRVDIKEKNGCYEIIAELPGVEKENLSVTLEDGVLTLEASTEQESSEESEGKIIRKERRTGKFMRSFAVGKSLKEEDIQANFKNGVLTITAPKSEETAAEKKRISIS